MEADLDGRVLLLAPTARDADLARGIFERASLAAAHCRSVTDICAELARGAGAVLIPEEAIVDRERVELQPGSSSSRRGPTCRS